MSAKPHGNSPVQAANDVLAVVRPGRWALDAGCSSVAFASKTLWGLATVRGVFTSFAGVGTVGKDGSTHGRLEIESASLNTKNKTRDVHLRSADFFNAEAHPQVVVDVLSARLVNGHQVHLNAQLTVAGVCKPLQLVATVVDPSADEVTLQAEVEIDKREFGMTINRLKMLTDPSTVSVLARFTRAKTTE